MNEATREVIRRAFLEGFEPVLAVFEKLNAAWYEKFQRFNDRIITLEHRTQQTAEMMDTVENIASHPEKWHEAGALLEEALKRGRAE